MSNGTGGYYAKSEIDLEIARPLTATMAKMHRACQDNYITQAKGIRRLTPRECARLQGFPDDFKINVSDAQAYKQFGNAVTVKVSNAIAKSILEQVELGNA
jgi:DNA (cytosine-5)-methyltransferase 1